MPGTKFTLGPAKGRTRVPGMTKEIKLRGLLKRETRLGKA
jgi:hypothetical protein